MSCTRGSSFGNLHRSLFPEAMVFLRLNPISHNVQQNVVKDLVFGAKLPRQPAVLNSMQARSRKLAKRDQCNRLLQHSRATHSGQHPPSSHGTLGREMCQNHKKQTPTHAHTHTQRAHQHKQTTKPILEESWNIVSVSVWCLWWFLPHSLPTVR